MTAKDESDLPVLPFPDVDEVTTHRRSRSHGG